MLVLKYKITICFLFFSVCLFAQDVEPELMNKYNHYRQRLENEFIVISPDVELNGVNIPAIDRLIHPSGNKMLTWSDGNSNFNNYIMMLVTEIEMLKRYDKDYNNTLAELLYTMLAIERLDLYSEYDLRVFFDKKILHNGDSINSYIRYPADINGFMLRDDVSFGFWMTFHDHFGMEFGKPEENFKRTSTYRSVFQRGIEPMQAMSQDNVIRMLEAMSVLKHFIGKESIENIPLNFINNFIPEYLDDKGIMRGDTVDFGLWAIDISSRLIRNMQQPEEQAAMTFKPWNSIGSESKINFPSLFSTHWYMTNLVLKKHVAEGSGNDFGIFINSYGLGEIGHAITGVDSFHYDGSSHGLQKWLFHSIVYKELKLPFGAIALPRDLDDGLSRTLANYGNVNGNHSRVFFALRDKRDDSTYEHFILTNFLMNKEDLKDVYHQGTEMWTEDSTFIADLLVVAPPEGPFSDTSRAGFTIHWSTSSRLIWPSDELTHRASKNYEFAGIDYLLLYNLYRLVYGGNEYSLKINPVRKKNNSINMYTREGEITNKMYFQHAPVIKNSN